ASVPASHTGKFLQSILDADRIAEAAVPSGGTPRKTAARKAAPAKQTAAVKKTAAAKKATATKAKATATGTKAAAAKKTTRARKA
ncbi:hypothetical protein GTW37_38735, partial [Streptomyces sp. SID4931]|nr:hypothetical protein [Streptomyces sp. SID4931]